MSARPLALQQEIDRAEFNAVKKHIDRAVNEKYRQNQSEGELNLPDGLGSEYDRQNRHYTQLYAINTLTGTLTFADIFLKEVFDLMTVNTQDFDDKAARIQAILHRWIAARARRPFVQCVGCPGECDKCSSGNWDLICDECRSYAAQDYELDTLEGVS